MVPRDVYLEIDRLWRAAVADFSETRDYSSDALDRYHYALADAIRKYPDFEVEQLSSMLDSI